MTNISRRNFLAGAAGAGRGEDALDMLEHLNRKDLQDTGCDVLMDHLMNTAEGADIMKVLVPRVKMELLTPYRAYFRKNLPEGLAEKFRIFQSLGTFTCN